MSKKRMTQLTEGVLLPLGVTVAGGVAANQFPQNRKSTKKAVKEVKKNLKPQFATPYAEQMYELVMKMDDEEALWFTQMVVAEVMDEDIRANERVLQSHINEVVLKRISDLKKVTKEQIAKSDSDEGWEFAKNLVAFEKAVKNPYQYGFYQFEESDFRRDPQTGRFATKVTQTQRRKPLNDKQAKNLGISTNAAGYGKLTDPEKAQFQHEYMQVANFLGQAANFGGSDTDVVIRVKNKGGGHYWKKINGTPKAGEDWDPSAGERVVEIEAQPKGGLSLGGAAFGLTSALDNKPARMERLNNLDREGFKNFAETWQQDNFDPRNSNDQLYHRVKTGSNFLMENFDEDSKVHRAARFARVVGDHGQSAERLFGPATRRTAYRYRGVEKAPEQEVMEDYDRVVGESKLPASERAKLGIIPQALSPDESKRRAAYVRQEVNRAREEKNWAIADARGETIRRTGQAFDEETRRLVPTSNIPDEDLDAHEYAAAKNKATKDWMDRRAEALSGKPTEEKLTSGRQVLIDHLMDKARRPNPKLYQLQLESGVTPPSEGFIIDKNGKVVTQAIGYGDDHYLPFNLKKLSKLRGGEYVRTRNVGGPTTEDIYTGLMAGATKITVVSRSGTFTFDFEQDFKKGRRYNDKAFRMIRRYEQLLDTVQSKTVNRKVSVSQVVREHLTEQAREDGYIGTELRPEVQSRIKDYKREIEMTAGDKAESELFFEEMTSDLSEGKAAQIRAAMQEDFKTENEFVFQLNGRGYGDAMKALEEQFPYYFKADYHAERPELDQGYVEPGRNRPTAAKVGLYGTNKGPGGQGQPQGARYSASTANYQRGKVYREGATAASETGSAKNGELTPVNQTPEQKEAQELKNKMAARKARTDANKSALALHQAIRIHTKNLPEDLKWVDQEEADAENWLRDPKQFRQFEQFVKENKSKYKDQIDTKLFKDFEDAAGRIDRVPYPDDNIALAFSRTSKPFIFKGPAYDAGAKPNVIAAEVRKINARSKPLSTNKSLGALSDAELANELDALIDVREALRDEPQDDSKESIDRRKKVLRNAEVEGANANRFAERNKLEQHVKDVHRIRALNLSGRDRDEEPDVVITRHKEPRFKDDPETKERRDMLTKVAAQYRVAAKYHGEGGVGRKKAAADTLNNIAANMEQLANEVVIAEGSYDAMMDQNRANPLVGEALKNWEQRNQREGNGT